MQLFCHRKREKYDAGARARRRGGRKAGKDAGMLPVRKEGLREGRWGVLDYGDVIVHIFNEESRLYYYLERLWDSGRNIERYEDAQ